MENINYENLGAIRHDQGESDILLGSASAETVSIPPSYFPEDLGILIESQHQIPACGSHAGNYLAEMFSKVQDGTPAHLSPEYLWKRIKQMDGFPAQDGTSMLYIMKALQKYGTCSAALMPNDTFNTLANYTDPSTITPAMDSDAANYRIDTYGFAWSPTFEQIKETIYRHKFVIMNLQVGQEFWTRKDGISSWQEKDILPLRPTEKVTSGHFVLAYAYDEKYVYFYNEWGREWGRDGIGYFGADYASRCFQLGTAIDIAKAVFSAALKYGSRGSAVSLLQRKLGIGVDGIFGNRTRQAVKKFQDVHGLVADGIVGAKTNSALSNS